MYLSPNTTHVVVTFLIQKNIYCIKKVDKLLQYTFLIILLQYIYFCINPFFLDRFFLFQICHPSCFVSFWKHRLQFIFFFLFSMVPQQKTYCNKCESRRDNTSSAQLHISVKHLDVNYIPSICYIFPNLSSYLLASILRQTNTNLHQVSKCTFETNVHNHYWVRFKTISLQMHN